MIVDELEGADKLKSLVDQIESLEAEKASVAELIKDKYSEVKYTGFDVKIVRKIIALRKKDKQELSEEEMLLETYKRALGMSDTPLGAWADQQEQAA